MTKVLIVGPKEYYDKKKVAFEAIGWETVWQVKISETKWKRAK